MSRGPISYERQHARDRLRDVEPYMVKTGLKLSCGHRSKGAPVAETYAIAWYECSEGCGVKSTRRRS